MTIYTCTLNPAIDQLCSADLKLYQLNILPELSIRPAGKGINVSRILHQFGIVSTLLGFLAGSNGIWIDEQLKEQGLKTRFIFTAGQTRANLKINSEHGCTEINQKGPYIPQDKRREFFEQLGALDQGDLLVISGSMPGGLPDDTLESMIKTAHTRGARVILDSSGEPFFRALNAHPDFIKPNDLEMKEFFQEQWPEDNDRTAIFALCQYLLQEKNIQGMLLSMGKQGACYITQSTAIYSPANPIERAYPTGAGDSMVAALSYLYATNPEALYKDSPLVLKTAQAFATMCCQNPDDVLVDPQKIQEYIDRTSEI